MKKAYFCLKPIDMRFCLIFLLTFVTLISCKESPKNVAVTDAENTEVPLSIAEQIASNYGIDKWKDVSELRFTFNVTSGERRTNRSYIWNTKTQDVVLMNDSNIIQYNRNDNLDSLQLFADKRFVNDSFWLLSPFKLVWDEGTSISYEDKVIAPISKESLNKLTIVYSSEGGYTPGDAYDFYYTGDLEIKEWGYRRGNAEEASMSTSWTKLESFNGIKLNTRHNDSSGNFELYFTNISVKN